MRVIDKQFDLFGRNDLEELLSFHDVACVSLFMPTHRMSGDTLQDPVRLRNLLDSAEPQLAAIGLRTPAIRDLLAPARKLQDGGAYSHFWQVQSSGLALFLAPGAFYVYRLPLEMTELTVVGGRFHVKPLLPMHTGDGVFYVLSLSQNAVRLLHGTRFSMHEIELPGGPKSMAETLRYDELEPHVQLHPVLRGGGGGETGAAFHGQGSAGDEAAAKKNLTRFVHEVQDGVQRRLIDQHAPLVLAGAETIQGYYRNENRYRYLLSERIEGNPEHWSADDLHSRAWPIVAKKFQAERESADALFRQYYNQGNHRAVFSIRQVLQATNHARVAVLFVPAHTQLWGKFDPATDQVEIHTELLPRDEDLFDAAVIHTLKNGGSVYLVEPNQMPYEVPIAATLRF